MSRGKSLPPPTGGDRLDAALRQRYNRDTGSDTPRTGASDRTQSTSGSPKMDRRSWYMPAETAAELARLVDDLHFSTRRPKHEVLAAIVEVAAARQEEIARRLS